VAKNFLLSFGSFTSSILPFSLYLLPFTFYLFHFPAFFFKKKILSYFFFVWLHLQGKGIKIGRQGRISGGTPSPFYFHSSIAPPISFLASHLPRFYASSTFPISYLASL